MELPADFLSLGRGSVIYDTVHVYDTVHIYGTIHTTNFFL